MNGVSFQFIARKGEVGEFNWSWCVPLYEQRRERVTLGIGVANPSWNGIRLAYKYPNRQTSLTKITSPSQKDMAETWKADEQLFQLLASLLHQVTISLHFCSYFLCSFHLLWFTLFGFLILFVIGSLVLAWWLMKHFVIYKCRGFKTMDLTSFIGRRTKHSLHGCGNLSLTDAF